MSLFERATKNKYRFSFKGQISVEELWDLSVQNLDSIYKDLAKEKKNQQEESLLETKTGDTELDDKIEIIKHIVDYKMKLKERNAKAKETKARNKKILDIIADKEDAALKNMSKEELVKMLEQED